ncbi:MAG: lamin tail domain-containing protein, partial [Bacteroidota bacterium]
TALCSQQIVINEVMYSNKHTLHDSFEETPDWIELYNTGDFPVNLKNWQITDNSEKDSYWVFPEMYIQAHSYLIVFASGKNQKDTAELHTDFKLSQMNEDVYLYTPQGICADSVDAQCVPHDLSIGYVSDGVGNKVVLEPSPAVSNNTSAVIDTIDFAPSEIHFSHNSGIYSSEIMMKMIASNPDAVIYYSLDGSEPDEEDAKYSFPVSLHNRVFEDVRYADIKTSGKWHKPRGNIYKGTSFRAVAYKSGCPASPIYSKTFFVDSLFHSRYAVPVVSIITDPDNLFDKDEGIYVQGNHGNYSQRGKKWECEWESCAKSKCRLAYSWRSFACRTTKKPSLICS